MSTNNMDFLVDPLLDTRMISRSLLFVQMNNLQVHALQEQLSIYQAQLTETQLELSKTITECDTIKASFTELVSVLRLPDSTDPLSFSLADDTLTGHNKARPLKDSHPKICFWSRADYNKYIENAESGTGTWGKAPWLELKDGRPVTIKQLKAICKVLRAAWAELVVQKLAPPTWSRICATGKKLVFDIMKNNLGTDRNWKDIPGKLSAKEEHIDDLDELEVLELKRTEARAKGNGKRHLSDDSKTLVQQDHLKKPKYQDSEPGTSANICVPSPIDDCLALENTRITPIYPCDASAPPFGVHLLQPTPQGSSLPRSPLHPTVSTSENTTLPTCHTPGTSQNIQLECADKENEIILQDPLADIFGPDGIAKTVPAPALSPIKKTNDDGPSASNNKLAAKADGKKKMQPETYAHGIG
ncbi:hypothetical protein BDR03DRAFT_986658 [Suillus americanus]|nr:hypothetical protein BDR03DRAFT_986658 [Suillus americanus]